MSAVVTLIEEFEALLDRQAVQFLLGRLPYLWVAVSPTPSHAGTHRLCISSAVSCWRWFGRVLLYRPHTGV
jgi:hypothetical protein